MITAKEIGGMTGDLLALFGSVWLLSGFSIGVATGRKFPKS